MPTSSADQESKSSCPVDVRDGWRRKVLVVCPFVLCVPPQAQEMRSANESRFRTETRIALNGVGNLG